MLDLKETDAALHQAFIGAPLSAVTDTLSWLDKADKTVILRCLLIPEYNLRLSHLSSIASLSRLYHCVTAIQLEPYHPWGIDKYEALGRTAPFPRREPLSRKEAEQFCMFLQSLTTIPVELL